MMKIGDTEKLCRRFYINQKEYPYIIVSDFNLQNKIQDLFRWEQRYR